MYDEVTLSTVMVKIGMGQQAEASTEVPLDTFTLDSTGKMWNLVTVRPDCSQLLPRLIGNSEGDLHGESISEHALVEKSTRE